ncbi:MAG: hypothetical protein PF505_03925, partial [Vallitaleaceae bacterium]|nr:hypothetical protein [Vallitaleaceae bacterium]
KVLPDYNEAQQALYEVFDTEVIYDFESFEEVIITNRKKISIILTKMIKGQLIEDYLNEAFEKVLEGLIIDLHMKHTEGAFIKIFHKLIIRSILINDIELDWQGFIYGFIITINKIQMILPLYKFMQEITHLTSVVVTNLSIRSDMHREYDYKNLYYRTSFLIQEMSTVQTKKEMIEIVLKTIEESKFKRYYICLFDDFIEVDSGYEIKYPDDVNMIFGYEDGRVLEPLRFKTKEMMPNHMLYHENRADLAFFSIYDNNRHFGYLVADIASVRRTIFRMLRELICSALMQVGLHEELGSYKKQLKELSDTDDHQS